MIGKKVLLVDDDPDFLQLTSLALEKIGAKVIVAYNGMEGISKASAYLPDLILLDVMMPGMSGFEACKKIRQFSNAPLIFVTALDEERDMLQGLEAGADEFLSKPFNWNVLLARARAVMRRSEQTDGRQVDFDYDDGNLKIDVARHRVLIRDKQIKLTPVEFRLLAYLVRNSERVLSFDEILVNVWGSHYQGNNDYVHVYISHLRSKIEENTKSPRYIQSVHGMGYIFEKQVYKFPPSGTYNKESLSLNEEVGNYRN
jgi:DNA-binding response OmpR family regulator